MKLPDWLAGRTRKLFFDVAYWRRPPWDTGITPPEVCTFISAHPPGRALDLGCGTGTNAIYLARHGWEAWGADFSGKAVQAGRRKARQAGLNVQLIHADVSQALPVPGKFNLILDIGCLHTLPLNLRIGYEQNLRTLLQTGGTYLLYGFINETETSGATGLRDADFDRLSTWLRLVSRAEGKDPNGRTSVWVEYRREA